LQSFGQIFFNIRTSTRADKLRTQLNDKKMAHSSQLGYRAPIYSLERSIFNGHPEDALDRIFWS
jgi:hypothetical protein